MKFLKLFELPGKRIAANIAALTFRETDRDAGRREAEGGKLFALRIETELVAVKGHARFQSKCIPRAKTDRENTSIITCLVELGPDLFGPFSWNKQLKTERFTGITGPGDQYLRS